MDETKFRVCVLCMTYNQASYIEETMEGFCKQKTDFPFVCCIVDDASNDGEQDVIMEYLKSNFQSEEGLYRDETDLAIIVSARHATNLNCYFKVIFLKNNMYKTKGGYKIKLNIIYPWRSVCEYEAMCEGDDYWTDENKLQKQVSFLDQNKDYSICSHRILKYDQESNIYYKDRLDAMFSGKIGCDFTNRTKVWISETSSIVYRLSAEEEFYNYPFVKRDNIHVYFLLKKGIGFCLSEKMSVYRLHEGGVFSKQDVKNKLLNGTYKATKDLFKYEQTKDARIIYYRNYAYTFLKTKGRILFLEKFELRKFLSLFKNIFEIACKKHPLYIACK